jgi:arginase
MGDGPVPLIRHVTRPYRADQVFFAAVRDCDPAEIDDMGRMQIFNLPVAGAPADVIAAIKVRGLTRVHLHLDLDCLDPAAFPFVGVPALAGLTIDQLCRLLADLRAAFTLAGGSITECNLADADQAARARPLLQRILSEGFGV